MTTIHVTTTFTVAADQTFAFSNQEAFGVADTVFSTTPPPITLYNYGSIVADNPGTAILAGNNSLVWNEAGGSIVVTGNGDQTGYSGTAYYEPSGLHNSGYFSVTSADGFAMGAYAEGTNMSVTNDGTMLVQSGTGSALGIEPWNYATVSNSGTLEVDGGTSAIGIGFDYYDSSIDNSGTIIAKGPDAADSYAIQISSTAFNIPITNSGTMIGQIAFYGAGFGAATLTNTSTGHIYGDINFGQYDGGYGTLDDNDVIHNNGTIVGTIHMGVNNDTYDGSGTVQGAIYGDLGNDTITGGAGNDVIYGDGTTDTSHDGNDTLSGGAGDDLLTGGGSINTLDGGPGSDTAGYATAQANVTVSLAVSGAQFTGGAGDDTLISIENLLGSNYDDTLTGNGGNNIITGGGGDDHLNGGGGVDTAGYSSLHQDYSIVTGRGSTTVTDLRAGSPDGTDTLTSFEKYQFADGTFVYDNTGAAVGTVTDTGNAAWSSIVTTYDVLGSQTSQSVLNDNGSEVVTTYDPSQSQSFAWKVDSFDTHGHLASESGQYDNGKHWLTLNDLANEYSWKTAIITFDHDWNVLSVRGTNDDNSAITSPVPVESALDTFTWFNTPYGADFGGSQANVQGGGAEADILYGHGGTNVLNGGGGDDLLVGGTGSNTLTGEAGNDRFVFHAGDAGHDIVTDFTAGDTVELDGYDIANFTALQSLMSQSGSDVVIAIDSAHHITLQNVTLAQLHAGDFAFG